MSEVDQRNLLTTHIIQKEYEMTHDGEKCELTADDFSIEDRMLSLDAFSRKQGWIK